MSDPDPAAFIVQNLKAAEDRRSEARAQLVPALEKITEALTHHWTTGSGRRLRQIVWSIYNASAPVVLGDALTNFDSEFGGAVVALIQAKICGVDDIDDLLRNVLEESGEMARYDEAAAGTPEDEEIIYPPLPASMSAEALRSLAASAANQERRLEAASRAESQRWEGE